MAGLAAQPGEITNVLHSCPYHPQSRGKNERFHRTLAAEVLAFECLPNLAAVRHAFDRWRAVYNFERPHEGIGQDVPSSRYRPRPRVMTNRLPEVEYDQGEIVRRVPTTKDYISFKDRLWKVPQVFREERGAGSGKGDHEFNGAAMLGHAE